MTSENSVEFQTLLFQSIFTEFTEDSLDNYSAILWLKINKFLKWLKF